jgi:hypothetical protein
MLNAFLMLVAVCLLAGIVWNSDAFNLTCIISKKDGNTYCVRDVGKKSESADLLADVAQRMRHLVNHLAEEFPNDERVKLLKKNFDPTKIVENLPNSEYTAYSENKGEKIALCLRKEKHKLKLIDINTLTFVALHELAHLMTSSIGHGSDFWSNFKFILKHAVAIGIYRSIDYSKTPQPYCGMPIDSNPLFS